MHLNNQMKIGTFLLIVVAFCISSFVSLQPSGRPDSNAYKVKGVCWEARDSVTSRNTESLVDYHINWISQTPFGWQQAYNQPEIHFHSNRGLWGERDIGLSHTAYLAKQSGVSTLLKPHIWLRSRDGKWRSDIEMDSESDWDKWFDHYQDFILHHAHLAEQHEFEALCIGTELLIPATRFEQKWREIIAEIRKVYSGKLTYAANFDREFEQIQFWDALDVIGIQAYFPLTKNESPTLNELKKGWKPHYKKLKNLSEQWDKPIVFTELGYKSSVDAAIRPWEWEQRGVVEPDFICHTTQALCYEAVFDTFWEEDWIVGFFFWKWTSENYGPGVTNKPRRRTRSPVSFTPKREGLEVIQEWYSR